MSLFCTVEAGHRIAISSRGQKMNLKSWDTQLKCLCSRIILNRTILNSQNILRRIARLMRIRSLSDTLQVALRPCDFLKKQKGVALCSLVLLIILCLQTARNAHPFRARSIADTTTGRFARMCGTLSHSTIVAIRSSRLRTEKHIPISSTEYISRVGERAATL